MGGTGSVLIFSLLLHKIVWMVSLSYRSSVPSPVSWSLKRVTLYSTWLYLKHSWSTHYQQIAEEAPVTRAVHAMPIAC